MAFVIRHSGQEHKLSVFTKGLDLIAYFARTVPVMVIPVRYIASALLLGSFFGIKIIALQIFFTF